MEVNYELIAGVLVGIGLSACCGLRVFLPILIAAVGAKLGWISLTGNFEWMTSWLAITGFAVAAIVEVASFYIPFVDNALDAIAAPVAVLAGILVSASTMVDLDPTLQWILSIMVGGGTAGLVHAGTSLLRLGSSTTTAGVGNSIVATGETGFSIIGSLGAILLPMVVGLFIFVAVLILAILLFRKLVSRNA